MQGVWLGPVLHSRTKHAKIGFHFIKEKVQKGKLVVKHGLSKDHITDFVNKGQFFLSFLLIPFLIRAGSFQTSLKPFIFHPIRDKSSGP